MLDIIEIVDINQRLAYVYITIIGQLNGNWSLICLFPRQNTSLYRFNNVNQTKWLNWYEHYSNLKYWTIKSVFELNFER
jgi:hypothetical protein